MLKQRTLKNSIKATGIGVHTGKKVLLELRPAAPDTGIVFRRIDLDIPVEIPATPEAVGDTLFSTTIVKGNVKIATVEHLLAAASGLGIDNMYVDVTAPEIPIMDGSSAPFVFLMQSAGIEEQSAPRRLIRIKKPIEIKDGDRSARLEPSDSFKISFDIEYKHPMFKEDICHASVDFSKVSFAKEVSRARTYGFLRDYEMLRENNLAVGASLDNAVVLDEFRIMNDGGLRYKDEFVKHKVLDALGDMYLLGKHVLGHFQGYKSGHKLNNHLMQALLADSSAWDIVTFESTDKGYSCDGMLVQPLLCA